jgi:hypothetical protein
VVVSPLGEPAQIVAIRIEGSAAVTGQERRRSQLSLVEARVGWRLRNDEHDCRFKNRHDGTSLIVGVPAEPHPWYVAAAKETIKLRLLRPNSPLGRSS